MGKVIGFVAVLGVGMWAIGNFGGLFGLTKDEVQAIDAYKNKAIDRAVPLISPVMNKQDILNAERKFNEAMPTSKEVQTAFETQIVPAVINTAHKIGKAAQSEIAKSSAHREQEIYRPIMEPAQSDTEDEQVEPDAPPKSNVPVYQQ